MKKKQTQPDSERRLQEEIERLRDVVISLTPDTSLACSRHSFTTFAMRSERAMARGDEPHPGGL